MAHTGGMATVVDLYAPAGGTITDLESEAGQMANEQFSETTVDGHDVWRGVVILDPERREVLTYKVTTSTKATSQLTIDSTPTLLEVAGWQDDDKQDSDFQLEDGDAYGSYGDDDSSKIDSLLSNSATSGRSTSTSTSSSSSSTYSSESYDTYETTTDTSDSYDGYYGYSDTTGTDSYDSGDGYGYDNSYGSSDGYSSYDDTSGGYSYSDGSGGTDSGYSGDIAYSSSDGSSSGYGYSDSSGGGTGYDYSGYDQSY